MQIRIREKDGANLFIPLPTGLVFNRLTAWIAARAAAEHGGFSIAPGRLYALFSAAKRYKKAHPDWTLVEVWDSDGDYVKIKL